MKPLLVESWMKFVSMSWLRDMTHQGRPYWVSRVQTLIANNTKYNNETGHGETDTEWIHQLVDEVEKGLPPLGSTPYDGNMRMAAILSMVLGLWYSQVHFAKTQDSHRPLFDRRMAAIKRQAWIMSMIDHITDTSGCSTYFPGQPWESPWSPEAKSGDFL